MSDLREPIRERIAEIERELREMSVRRTKLEDLRGIMLAALTTEEALRNLKQADQPSLALHPTTDGRALADFLLKALKTGPKTLDQMKGLTTHLFPSDASSPGRSINITLVGLQKGGYVDRSNEDNTWFLVSPAGGNENGVLRKQDPVTAGGSSNGEDPVTTPPKSQFDPGSPHQH